MSIEDHLRLLEQAQIQLLPAGVRAVRSCAAARCSPSPESVVELLWLLGGGEPGSASGLMSPDVWWLDTECIVEPGDYSALLRRLDTLLGGVGFDEVHDDIDMDSGVAQLSFRLRGTRYHVDLRCDGDWVDLTAFCFVEATARRHGCRRRIIAHWPGDQTILLVGGDEEAMARLTAVTGLPLSWLCD